MSRALVVLLIVAGLGGSLAEAQTDEDTARRTAADWVPFTGTFTVGCTRTNADNPGCPVHHPTWAIDFGTPTGTRIRAAGAGIVVGVHRGCAAGGGDGECNGGAGNMVVVDHGDYWSRYLHLSTIPKRIRVGRQVEEGDVVGRAGASGTFGGAHLHYDEYQPGPPSGRVAFGSMFACHGDRAVLYPQVLGYDRWDLVPPGSEVRNDNHDCGGHPAQPHPPPPEPPVYPKAPGLRLGGAPGIAALDVEGDGTHHLAIGIPGARPTRARTGAVVIVDPMRRRDQRLLRQGSPLAGRAESGDRFGSSVAVGDFDCDGRDDLAIGAPGEDLDDVFVDTGAVNVVFGDGDEQLVYSGSFLPSYYRRPHDWLGSALAVGDFGGDGCDDLAIASPGADRAGGLDMGLVWVLRGSSRGLGRAHQLLQGVNLGGVLENGDQTGYSLAAGDFDCDGRDDLAVGVPREELDEGRAGAVMVAYGTRRGFRRAHALYRGQVLPGAPRANELLGASLAAGDLDADGCDDLVVGAPNAAVSGRRRAGAAIVVFGDRRRLDASTRTAELTWEGLRGPPRRGDRASSALAVGDVDCDGHDDVLIGVPGRDVKGRANAGAVAVAHGRRGGVRPPGEVWRQGRGLRGRLHARAQVGQTVVAADLDGDACADAVIGAPGTTVGGHARAGSVLVAWGHAGAGRGRASVRLDQRTVDAGTSSPRVAFGSSSTIELLRRQLRR